MTKTVEQKVFAADAERILHSVDGLLQQSYNIYDIGKAMPHPYDAISDTAKQFLHDYKNFGAGLKKFMGKAIVQSSELNAAEAKLAAIRAEVDAWPDEYQRKATGIRLILAKDAS